MSTHSAEEHAVSRVVMIGHPNVGKSTLFSRLGGTRAHSSNFPGTTQDVQTVELELGDRAVELCDLPGVYVLKDMASHEASLCAHALEQPGTAVCLVLDATHLGRHLRLAAEIVRAQVPLVVALNRSDTVKQRGLNVDAEALSEQLGCAVIPTCATSGTGVAALKEALADARVPAPIAEGETDQHWAKTRTAAAIPSTGAHASDHLTDRLDGVVMHPVLGAALFAAVMTGLFWMVFKIATVPMDWIDVGFASLAAWVAGVLPAGPISALLTDGIITGVGATVIFLPQICLMFFLIALLEQSGYLPRAALLADRLLRPFGLPGQSFVPLLSSHACAIPGIIAARGIPDRRERVATMLVAPFMSCSARIPVYVLLTSLLFADRPGLAALAFTGCYVIGALAGLFSAVLVRRTILKGEGRVMAMELPGYRVPSVTDALAIAAARGGVFLRKAGTVILAMVVVLWWLGEYPHTSPPEAAEVLRTQAAQVDAEAAAALHEEADLLEARHAKSRSAMGMMGRAAAPAFAPLGYDWQLTVGVLSSFAAREVFVSTMAVVLAEHEDVTESQAGLDRLAASTRDDGSPVFNTATAASLLVFFILAMQCLPTLAVTARESGHWKWALLQLGYMSLLAYTAALVTYHAAGALLA